MKSSVYLETTVISYIASRPSRDLITAAQQQISIEWWDNRRQEFDLFISEVVIGEIQAGDSEAGARRVELVESVDSLALVPEAESLALNLIRTKALPESAIRDAFHLAIAALNGVDYLLTWNFKHIANAEKRSDIIRACDIAGYECPLICTPTELLGE